MLFKVLTCAVLLLTASKTTASEQGTRVALVIGNAAYASVPALRNPANDATDIAAALGRVGFDVDLVLDADDRQMRQRFRDFAERAETADLSLVYFAGHGIEVDRTNYLIPVNAQLATGLDVEFETLPLSLVMRSLARADGIKIVLIDACRDNPFAARLEERDGSRSIGTGLSRVDPIGGVLPGGILVGYAAREGTVAMDGVGRNSPYAQALLEHLEKPGLEVSKLFRRVRDRVFELTEGRQEPFTYGALPGADVFLVAAGPSAAENGSGLSAAVITAFATAQGEDTLEGWSAFLDAYGRLSENELVAIALRRHAELTVEKARQREMRNRPLWLRPASGRKAPPLALTKAERILLQKALNYGGFNTGGIDGQFGSKTRQAISEARQAAALPPGTEVTLELIRELPDPNLVDKLRARTARKYDPAELPLLLEPRLRNALSRLRDYHVVFGYFEGNLYIVAAGPGFGSWDSKNALAGRLGGHLVTLGSAAENAFVHDLFRNDPVFVAVDSSGNLRGPVIGLRQNPEGAEPAGGWAWVTGESLTYRNWGPGFPDHSGWRDDFANYYSRGANVNAASVWDDSQGSSKSFVIEIE